MAGPWLRVTDIREVIAVGLPCTDTKSGSEAVSFHGLSREPV